MKLTSIYPSLISLCLLSSITTAHAGNFSYNYIDGGLNHYLGSDEDITSFKLDGSINITPNLNLIAGIQSESADVEYLNVTLNQYKIGAGIHRPLNPDLDVIAEIAFINAELSFSGYDSASQNAVMLGAGLRQQLTDKLEGHAKLNLYNAEDSENSLEKEITFGGRLHFNEQLSGGLDFTKHNSGDGVLTTSIRLQSL